jgi:hypothetical protein
MMTGKKSASLLVEIHIKVAVLLDNRGHEKANN